MPEEVRANSGRSEAARGRPNTSDKPSHPEDFCKKTSGVREKMSRDLQNVTPEERIKTGNPH